ncbi:transglutaminase-like domain-containing protein [Jatrophihabitans fulvus]
MTTTTRPAATPVPRSRAIVRRTVPLLVLPLALVACVLASAPWLRAFPAAVMAVPLVGTALLSVLLPVVVIAVGVRSLWLTALVDVVGFAFFTTLVTLRAPGALDQLWTGLVHGPSQVLTFALPLVSPRALLVAPVALCWLCGAIIGECIGRGWQSVVPYATALVTFGLAYAATTRAIAGPDDNRRYDALLAGALLVTLLLLRVAQTWLEQDDDAEALQAEGVLPLRGLAIGTAVAVVVSLAAAFVVQSGALGGSPATAQRTPPLDTGRPLTPVAFVAGLRPEDPSDAGRRLFAVTFDRTASRYVAIADVDSYDGDSWSFSREFRPSGGVIPADPDPDARGRGPLVTQRYTVEDGTFAQTPWMPFQYRPRDVLGTAINTDQQSGMIVPAESLRAGQSYRVISSTTPTAVESLPAGALPGTSAPPSATSLPASVRSSIGTVISALQAETNTVGAPPLRFLQALVRDFRTNYTLSGGATTSAARPSATSTAPSRRPSSRPSGVPTPSPSPSDDNPRIGGNTFAGVLASILGSARAATPEQYATLVTLLARAQNVPARVVTGFRVGTGEGATVEAGTYQVQSRQAWTWSEVLVRGRGWVVVDAAPSRYTQPAPAPSASARPTPSASPSSTQNALVTQVPSDAGNAVGPKSDVPSARAPSAVLWLVLAAVVVLIAIAVPVALVLRNRRRTRRRRELADPRERLVGAWQETLDVLGDSGLSGLQGLTSSEVARATSDRFGPEPGHRAGSVGNAANVALFSTRAVVRDEDAAAAWRDQDLLRAAVRRTLSRRRRLLADLRPRRGRRG